MRFRLRLSVVLIVLVAVGVAAWVSVASLVAPAGVASHGLRLPERVGGLAGVYKLNSNMVGTGKGSVEVVLPAGSYGGRAR